MARAPPEGGLLRPPPKLRRKSPKPIPGNSGGSPHLHRHVYFTEPLPWHCPIQYPDRYASRAQEGQNRKSFKSQSGYAFSYLSFRGFVFLYCKVRHLLTPRDSFQMSVTIR
ncbi:hypothetical protein HN873_062404 [Arachis hypogaea]